MVKLCFCYSDDDKLFAQAIANDIAQYAVDITNVIDDCDYSVLIFGDGTATSEQVKDAIAYVIGKQKSIIPVMLQRANIGNFFFLLDSQNRIIPTSDNPEEVTQNLLQIIGVPNVKSSRKIIELSPPIFRLPNSPQSQQNQFFFATALTLTDTSKAIFLYQHLLKIEPNFANGTIKTFVERHENTFKASWLQRLQSEADTAIQSRQWDEVNAIIHQIKMIDTSIATQIIARLHEGLLSAKLEEATIALENDDTNTARNIANEMLEIKPDDSRALDIIDQINRHQEAEAIYQQAIDAKAQGLTEVLGILLNHIHAIDPDFDDSQNLLKSFSISPLFVTALHEKHTLEGHRGDINCIALSPDGTLIASGSADNTIRLWSMPDAQQVAALRRDDGAIRQLSYSRDGQHLMSLSSENVIRIWAMPEGREVLTFDTESDAEQVGLIGFKSADRIGSLIFTPDAQHMVVGYVTGEIKIIAIESGQAVLTIPAHSNWVNALAFSKAGNLLASGSADHLVRLWHVEEKGVIELATLDGHKMMVNEVAISPNGYYVASVANEADAKLWNTQTGKLLFDLAHKPNTTIKSVAFSQDGEIIATAGTDATIKLWAVATGTLLTILTTEKHSINAIRFSSDGSQIISGGADQILRVWGIS